MPTNPATLSAPCPKASSNPLTTALKKALRSERDPQVRTWLRALLAGDKAVEERREQADRLVETREATPGDVAVTPIL